ncbi:MAG: CBS domain-containing protein [Candidatus Thermoplasmatota archaeon]|nr:CBS domain-containing protein [Candidatus Thermoplasmatota archaeon]
MENRIGFLVIIVVHNVAKLPDLLHAWQKIGVPGATILRSTGAYRMTTWLSRVGLGGLERLLDSEDSGQRTLLAGIEDPDLLARAIAEAERAMGNFDEPHSGLLLVVPVAQVKGLHKTRRRETPTPLPAAVQPDWVVRRDTPIEKVLPMLLREAATVLRETPLEDVAEVVLRVPGVQVAAVTEADGRLVGVLDLHSLANDLFFRIMPEEFLRDITDMEEMMDFARKSTLRTAGDAMSEPVWITQGDTLKEAFKRMHDHRLPGLPVVDGRYHVIGYIDLLTLLSCCVGRIEGPDGGPGKEQAA